MGPSCQGKSFPAPVENLVPQILPSVSLTLIDSICFFFDILLLGDITLAAIFYNFHWKAGFENNNLVSCEWQMT